MDTNALTKLDTATRMLAEIATVDDAAKLIDLAEAARVYARQVKLGIEAQNHAAEIKIRAQRRAGEILDAMPKAKGTQGQFGGKDTSGGYALQPLEDTIPTYADLGIDKRDAHIWQTIAGMPAAEFETTIAEALEENKELTTAIVYRTAKFENAKIGKTPPPPMFGKYRIIYADPPWKYGDQFGVEGYKISAEQHYPTLSIADLCLLPVKDLAEDNAVLFIWVTSPLLEESFQVIEAWGFEYKTSFVWDKIKHNMGHYNSVRHEFLLVCTRGSCVPDVMKLFDSVYSEERTEHSVKPEYFRQVIDTIYPTGKRIELFARRPADGWEAWGNEPISS